MVQKILALAVVLLFCAVADAQNLSKIEKSAALQKLIDRAAEQTIAAFADKNFKAENLAITLIDLRDAGNPRAADFRGAEPIYPASVVKLFYLAAAHEQLKTGKLLDSPELRRALRDMIVDSSNDATHNIVDVLTDAAGGGELAPKELEKWAQKRNLVNRYFAGMNYTGINVNQKTYCEDLYGRERQFWNAGKNRNKLTTNATARLLAEIALGKSVAPEHARQMMELLKRAPLKQTADADSQDTGFTGLALKQPGVKLWSKAGWTSNSRHDAAYVETADGQKFVLVVFTEKFSNEREIIPTVARAVLAELGNVK